MKLSLLTSKSKLQKKKNYICFEQNILSWCQKEEKGDFSKFYSFWRQFRCQYSKQKHDFFCMCLIQKDILEKIVKK